jgi:hypothetical protein
MSDIVVSEGLFPSKSQARSNGWHKPVPFGFTDMYIGKAKKRVTIFKEIR